MSERMNWGIPPIEKYKDYSSQSWRTLKFIRKIVACANYEKKTYCCRLGVGSPNLGLKNPIFFK